MSTTVLPADYQARARALDPEQSFAVTAPAGSGKTGLLTQRVLKLLTGCEHPEEVLCITFTRKAAGEMQERITKAIWRAAKSPRPDNPHDQLTWDLAQQVLQRDQQYHWQLLNNPNRLRIQTIDGLCGALTRQNPLTSQIGGQAQMLDQPEHAYRQAVIETLALLETESALKDDLGNLLTHLDNHAEAVISLLVALLARRDQWLPHLMNIRHARPYLEDVLAGLSRECLEETCGLLQPWASDIALLADYAGNNCLTAQPESALCTLAGITCLPECEANQLEHWRALTDFVLTKQGDWRSPKGLNKNCGFPPGDDKAGKATAKARKDAMAELLAELAAQPKLLDQLLLIRYLPPATYERSQWRLLNSLTRILPYLVARLKLVFRQLNATDFSEITQAALHAFGDSDNPSDMALALDYRIRHILVDEFQDTASPQLQLLERLTEGWQPGDGRTLFIVGDGMQSCYGFRDANVGIFLDARRRGIGNVTLTPLELTVNFRSQSGIIEWVNRVFTRAFPNADDIARGAVCYSDAIAHHPPLPLAAVQLHLCQDETDRQAEAQLVCQLVAEAQARDPEGSIAILVRNRGHLQAILPELQAASLSYQATDLDPLSKRMAITDLLSLTRALLEPADRIAWLAVLRAPWCGLDLHDLHTLAGLKPATTAGSTQSSSGEYPLLLQQLLTLQQLTQPITPQLSASATPLSEHGKQLLERFTRVIHSAWQQRRRKNLRQWIEGTWIALGGPGCLLDTSDIDNCHTYFALLEKFDQGAQIPDWAEFTRAVEKLYAAPAKNGDPRLQVMTIHKSKGLEFDTVIIPGLDKGGRADEHQLLLWQERINRDGDKQLVLSTLSPTGQDNDPVYHYLREEQKLKNRLEATRLLYVGCTRAIKQLHLLANASSDAKSGELKSPPSGSLLNCLWPALSDADKLIRPCSNGPGTSDTDANASVNNNSVANLLLPYSLRLPADWRRPVLVPETTLAAFRGREFSDDDNLVSITEFTNRHARATGTLLHRILQQIGGEGVEHWHNQRIQQQLPVWHMQLRQLGVNGRAQQQALEQIELAVRKTLSDPVGQWLLNPTHTDSQCELAIQYMARDAKIAIIDRTFIDKGTRWIIDYKSSSPAATQSLNEFLHAEKTQYQPQLERYAELFRQRGETAINTALYFPLLQHLEPIDAS